MSTTDNKFVDPRMDKAKRRKLSGRSITVQVGPAADTEFVVCEDMICGSSEFFKTMMASEFQESTTRLVKLPDVSSDSFNDYLEWLYTRRIYTLELGDEKPTSNADEWIDLTALYALGDKLCDTKFQNCIIDALVAKSTSSIDGSQWFPTGHTIANIYNVTVPSSPLRLLVVDWHVEHAHEGWLEDRKGDVLPRDFLLDFARAVVERRPKPDKKLSSRALTSCSYHKHTEGDQRCQRTQAS